MTETLEVKPEIGTEAWVHQNHINVLMDQGWHFRVSGYNEGYCKVEIVGRSENSEEEKEEEGEEEETTFEKKMCDICGKEFTPEDYETETSAGKALGGHMTQHRGEPNDEEEESEEQTGLNTLFSKEEEEAEA